MAVDLENPFPPCARPAIIGACQSLPLDLKDALVLCRMFPASAAAADLRPWETKADVPVRTLAAAALGVADVACHAARWHVPAPRPWDDV